MGGLHLFAQLKTDVGPPCMLAAGAGLLSTSFFQPLLDGANALAKAPEYDGVRYLFALALGLLTFVRVVLPPVLEVIKTHRLATSKLTQDGPVTYKKLYEDEIDRVLALHFEHENCKRSSESKDAEIASLRERNVQLAGFVQSFGIALPPAAPQPEKKSELSPRELLAEGAPQKPEETT